MIYKDILYLIAKYINDRETLYSFSQCNKQCQSIAKQIYITKKYKYDQSKLMHGNALVGSFSCKYIPNDKGNLYLLDYNSELMRFIPRYDGCISKVWGDNDINKPRIPAMIKEVKTSKKILIDHISIISKYKK